MLELDDIRAGYGRTEVIHGVSLTVPSDGVAAVMGHNGAGKTTLLRAAVGLIKADVRARCCSTARTSRRCGRAPEWRAASPTCRRASSRSVS